MSNILLYLLEVSVVLSLLYLLYLLLLRKETFFNLNRFFLLGILAFSFLLPLVSFEFIESKEHIISQPIDQLGSVRVSYYDALAEWNFEGNSDEKETFFMQESGRLSPINGFTIMTLFLIVYLIGAISVLIRLGWIYLTIDRLRRSYPRTSIEGITVVKVLHPITPFSFLNCVFVPKDLPDNEEFGQILAHEKTHIQQRHSFDLLFVQLLAAVLWFNPVIWLLIKSLKTTHEYIADKKMINQGYSLVEYQSLLLRQLISNNSYGLVHNFNLTFIKKRITMMKIKESGWVGRAKASLVLSIALVFSLVMLQCNSRIDDQISIPVVESNLGSDLSLPLLPQTNYAFKGDLSQAIKIEIADNQVRLNGKALSSNEISSAIEKLNVSEKAIVEMKVDKDQSMALVRDVQWELRKANKRKLLYVGETEAGVSVDMAFLLPPTPDSEVGKLMPKIDDKYAEENDIDLFKMDLSNQLGIVNQQQVYTFVKDQIAKGKSNYVVSGKFDDNTRYGDYLLNLTYIQEGFNSIYQERSKEIFGKNFYDLDRDIPEEKQQYNRVRKGVPRAISIAER